MVDDYTVRINLLKPFPLFLVDASNSGYGVVSPKYIKEHATEDDPWAFKWMNDHMSGTGPYRLTEWERGQKITYERNKDYWGGPQVGKGVPKAPYLDKVIELVIPNSSSRRMALEAGDIDIAEGLPPDDIIKLQANSNLKVEQFLAPWVVYLAYDVRYPPFSDKKVRKAISHAINYDEIISGPERGFAERLWSVLHNYALGEAPEKYVKYNYDPEKARQLLRQTEYPNGFTTEMYYATERRGQFEEISLLIQSYLKDIGIDVKLRKVAFPTQLNAQAKGNYGLALIVYKSSYADPESGVGWRICPDRNTGGWDPTHWEDPIAHNTTKGRETADTEERARLYQELAIKAADEAIYVPLYQFGLYFPMKKGIGDFRFDTDYGPAFWDVTKK